jgi:hypothetical protein
MSEKRGPGRPRKDPKKLAKWAPPEGWVRVVAWTSPEERKALKRVALEAETSVAELIRSLASGLQHGVITPEELLTQARKGMDVMEKIPTLFERDEHFKVTDRVRPGCEWVFQGEGRPTEKLDGTNVRLTLRSGQVVRVEKRRNPNKEQKAAGIVDGWYVDAARPNRSDQWIYEAVQNTQTADWPDGEHSCEALGPKIQGNPLQLDKHLCVPFNMKVPVYADLPRSFQGLAELLPTLESQYVPGVVTEGIVFHHPDGRRAKIKGRDFRK